MKQLYDATDSGFLFFFFFLNKIQSPTINWTMLKILNTGIKKGQRIFYLETMAITSDTHI